MSLPDSTNSYEHFCALCGAVNPSSTEKFCCQGCQLVYQILEARGALDQAIAHPVYQEASRMGLLSGSQTASHQAISDQYPLLFRVDGMWCPACALLISLVLQQLPGVVRCHVDYTTDIGEITYSPRETSKERLFKKMEQLGYAPSLLTVERSSLSSPLFLPFLIALFCSLNLMMFAYPIYAAHWSGDPEGYSPFFGWLSLLFALPILLYSASPVWKRCYEGWKQRIVGMETLIFLGVWSATLLSIQQLLTGGTSVYFDSMGLVILFLLLGKLIESKAKHSTQESLEKLALTLPKKGRKRLPNGTHAFVPVEQFQPGDVLVVEAGERIILDGTVVSGEGVCNEALMTGEAFPTAKSKGSIVLGGTHLEQGALEIAVSSLRDQSALGNLVEMIRSEFFQSHNTLPITEKVALWAVPTMILLALSTACVSALWGQAGVEESLLRAISVLLIACPCAIGIALPLAEARALALAARAGAVIRRRDVLRKLGKETICVCDKTGTITEGKFSVVAGLDTLSEQERSILKSLASHSKHPISQTISGSIPQCGPPLDQCEEVLGQGVRGSAHGSTYALGSASFFRSLNISLPATPPPPAYSPLYFGTPGAPAHLILLKDQPKRGIKEWIASLPLPTLLLSGDAPSVVETIAKECSIPMWAGEQRPEEKQKKIRALKQQGEVVLMLGDGLNDAPALASADVGIGVLSSSDLSLQAAAIVLTSERFDTIQELRSLGVAMRKIGVQNLIWAFSYNIVGIPLAMMGNMTPLFAAIAMTVSSVAVVSNTLRLRLRKAPHTRPP